MTKTAVSPTIEEDEDEIAIDKLLAEFKESRRRKAEKEAENAKRPIRLKVNIPKRLYGHCAQASAQIGISFDEFVTDALENYFTDEEKSRWAER